MDSIFDFTGAGVDSEAGLGPQVGPGVAAAGPQAGCQAAVDPVRAVGPQAAAFIRDWSLFVDLDGVLADFDRRVRELFGALPRDLPPRVMWPRLARVPGFYEHLDWLPGARDFWLALADLQPAILTGLPLGNWAEVQKRAWCRRELGPAVPVITCLSREKHLAARPLVRPGTRPVLVDDRASLQEAWEAAGGVFILHRSNAASLAALGELAGNGPAGPAV